MNSPSAVPAHRVLPRKSLGQHWLADSRAIRRIAAAAEVGPGDTVVEIGPGTGRLTAALTATGANVVAVEIDDDLVTLLRDRFSDTAVTVLNADVLELPPAEILESAAAAAPYVVVGNLPYNIGTAVIRHFLYGDPPPRAMVVMLQAEVAESIAAGSGKRSYLSVMVQAVASARLLFSLPPSAFKPPPKVHSAVVRLDLRDDPVVSRETLPHFLEFAQAGFRAPRKTLRNSLALGLQSENAAVDELVTAAGTDGKVRPADLELKEWAGLFEAWSARR